LDKHLHIVTHDVPWPADHGGVIDIFYTLKALHALGVNIHLHCFTQGRAPQEELEKYCSSVQYYPRKKNSSSFSLQIPLIVNSRVNEALLANLQKDNHPILLEGIHCSYYVYQGLLTGRKVIIRLFNTEYAYYQQLAVHEQDFNAPDIHYLPPFLPFTMAVCKTGNGSFCLYHGNLAINENEKAATWLLTHVFNKVSIPFVIAGKNPSRQLEKLAHKQQHTCLVANPSDKEMQDMIAKAHIHVLPSFNKTGIKLKLLNAFFNGRHCLVNKAAVAGSGLEDHCQLADDAVSFQQKIEALYTVPFTEEETERRQGLLQTIYNNDANAKKLMTFLW
jgi:hypothetical protein